jgi:hypothetical protein
MMKRMLLASVLATSLVLPVGLAAPTNKVATETEEDGVEDETNESSRKGAYAKKLWIGGGALAVLAVGEALRRYMPVNGIPYIPYFSWLTSSVERALDADQTQLNALQLKLKSAESGKLLSESDKAYNVPIQTEINKLTKRIAEYNSVLKERAATK